MGKNIESESMFPKSNSMRILEKIHEFLKGHPYQGKLEYVEILSPIAEGWIVKLICAHVGLDQCLVTFKNPVSD